MTEKQKKICALSLALLWHTLAVFSFVWLQTAKEDPLWSGGRSGAAGGMDGVIVVSIAGAIPPTPLNKGGTEGRGIPSPLGGRARPRQAAAGEGSSRRAEEEQRNAGTGNSTTPAGGVGSGLDATGTVSDTAPSVLALIRKKIAAKKKYPTAAYVKGIEGNVTVQFQINEDGTLAFVNVITSSGSAILDDAATQAVQKAAPLPFQAGAITLTLQYKIYQQHLL